MKNIIPGRKIEIIPLGKERAKTAVVRGANWFVTNRNAVALSRHRISSQFGIRHKTGGGEKDVEFIDLIPIGTQIDNGSVHARKHVGSDFRFDGGQVMFYQVMSADAKKAFIEKQKHKFSRVGTIDARFEVREVGIEIQFDDTVKGYIRMENEEVKKLDEETTIKDQEITDANEEHYTWIVN